MRAVPVLASLAALFVGGGGVKAAGAAIATGGAAPSVLAAAARVGARALRESAPKAAWAEALTPLRFVNVHGGDPVTVRLYGSDGTLDRAASARLDALLGEGEADEERRPPDPRLLQLVVKVADHFHASEIVVISQWRPDTKARAIAAAEARRARVANGGREPLWALPPSPPRQGSRHASGEAIDFVVSGVSSREVAAYARALARVGVGSYPHPRTGFVHLDVRSESFHWVDSSPPGRSWREVGITDHGAAARDRAYVAEDDLPDAARAR